MNARRLSRIGLALFLGAIAALFSLRFIVSMAAAPEDTASSEATQEFINQWLAIGSLLSWILIAGFLLWISAGLVSWNQKRATDKAQVNQSEA